VDVVVIGLGATGSATVFQLARRGVNVLGIDRFSPPHIFGSSFGDTRVTRPLTLEGVAYSALALRSHELWREIEAESGINILTTNGVLQIADSTLAPNAFAHHLQAADRFGVEYDLLDYRQLSDRFPQFGVRPHHFGFFEPGGGFLRPEEAIRAQLRLAERCGATIRRHEQVMAIDVNSTNVTVHTDQGMYTADRIVLAVGSWMSELVDQPELAALFGVYRQVLNWFNVDASRTALGPEHCPTFLWQYGAHAVERFYGFPSVDGKTMKSQATTTPPGRPETTLIGT
jgi:sarcosine oxidase